MDKEYKSLRTQYSINDEFVDDRLIEVNLLVMHDDVNLNCSSFSKETMEDAKETLKNVPILAYIKKDEYDDVDFDGHNIEIKMKENKDGDMEFKVYYLERPIGVIPETNDYHYEERDGKTYVACKGYLWKEYLNDGLEILQENSTKPISMEILVDDANYNSNTDIYEITKYRYLGVTVLGTDVLPAMSGAKMDVVGQFSINNNKEFFEKVKQLNEELKQSLLEGGEHVDKEFGEQVIEDIAEDFTETEVQNTENQEFGTEEEVEEPTVDTSEEEDIVDEEEFTKETVETETTENETYSKDEYESLLSSYNSLKEEFTHLETEVITLRDFKAEVELQNNLAEIEQVFEKYSTLLSNDDYEDLKDKALELGMDNLEKELSFRVVQKKFDFSKITKKDTTKVSIKDVKTEVDPYGSASVYFKK